MFKIVTSLFIISLFIGCGSSPKSVSTMFQTVSKEQVILTQSGSEKESCILCGMNLVKFYKTSHTSSSEETEHQYCSLHCLEEHLGHGINLKNPKVVDIVSLKLIPVHSAIYVVGSKKRGTMSRVSKYAFKDIKDARKFINLYGGKMMNFTQAREVTQKDFKHYR